MENQNFCLKRTHYCGQVLEDCVGNEVVVCGWVQRQRDLGQLIFIDLRDRSGIVQLAFDEGSDREIFNKAYSLRSEFVIAAKGVVRERSSKNPQIPTGNIEIFVNTLHIFSKSDITPFEILDEAKVKEELRLKYRYLDLRRKSVQEKIVARSQIIKMAREYLDKHGFIEIETPLLIKSTPEGARDYLVPSRIFPGKFFALPQSPQIYKQLIMMAGFDRYMQIAKCFRDEDLRADRQPEFTQIDFEMSFVDSEDIMKMVEGLIYKIYKNLLNFEVPLPLPRITYEESMRRFGSDKPDMRFQLELIDLTDLLKNTNFRVFADAVNSGGSVGAINVPRGASKISRKEIDKLGDWIKDYGASGLAWTKLNEDGNASSSYEKSLSEETVLSIREKTNLKNGDLLFLIANVSRETVLQSLGALRLEIAKKLSLIDDSKPNLLWVYDFPLFEFSKEEGRYVAQHHPFTMPKECDIQYLESHPEKVCAMAYDLVLNGNEVGGGSIRIHDPALQQQIFKALEISQECARESFGFLIEALKYGAPPHGGFAFGLDRLVMLLTKSGSIRDTIAFPKVSSTAELMSGAPADKVL
ncbi:MAG: aspartate--tRNA ligase [Oscillospiraceae bacterium]|jgi:aspartyl-tRNA synthetase|nr:aspartate--tRNA ligase [Oscillospiraceae bacterium]